MSNMSMPLHEIIGFVAGFGTTFAALPDLIAMLKRRSCEGMNPTMAAIMGTFQIVWVYYGILVESRPVDRLEYHRRGDQFFSGRGLFLLCFNHTAAHSVDQSSRAG